jgi:Rieske 2Fe-2S family protein
VEAVSDMSHLLERIEPTLPARYYYDADHYRRELETFWYRSWLYAGRASELPGPRTYKLFELADQSILILRDEGGRLRAFHNTCRHRGSLLCKEAKGELGRHLVCPYHAWTYSLEGRLVRTAYRVESEGFRLEDYPLHPVAVAEWGGFLYVNLEPEPGQALTDALGELPVRFRSWRPERLEIGHALTLPLACNWKVFWENFMECYHCPGVHPELCRVVPIYGRGIVSPREDPAALGADLAARRLAPGAVTWSLDGQTSFPWFEGLTEAEKTAGHTYWTMLPSCFFVAHVDYVRTVSVVPRGAERTDLVVDWLFPPGTLEDEHFDVERATEFGRLVLEQDGRVCELNQRGLHCRRQEAGVLVGQERGIYEFKRWVLERLGSPPFGRV